MSNQEFRRELNNLFDDVSGTPSSNLPDRVRSAIAQPPDVRAPYWLAAVAAAVMAVLIVSVLYVAGPLKPGPSQVGGVNPTASPSASSTATASPSPSKQPLICADDSIHVDGGVPPTAFVSALRTGAHPGYDRLTIEFANGEPANITISTQVGTRFVLSPSGVPTTVKGQNSLLITIHGADLHTSYTGSLDIVTGFKGLAEVKRVQDFEGVVQLGVGINGPACYRLSNLSAPDRVVIDIPTS